MMDPTDGSGRRIDVHAHFFPPVYHQALADQALVQVRDLGQSSSIRPRAGPPAA